MMTGVFSEKMYLPNLPRRPPVAALSSLSRANGMSFVNNLFANPIGVFLLSQPGQTAKGGGTDRNRGCGPKRTTKTRKEKTSTKAMAYVRNVAIFYGDGAHVARPLFPRWQRQLSNL